MLLFVRYVFNSKEYRISIYTSTNKIHRSTRASFQVVEYRIILLGIKYIFCIFQQTFSANYSTTFVLSLYFISNRKTIPMIKAYLTSHHSITFHKKRNCCIIKQQFLICILSNRLSVSSLLTVVLPFSPTVHRSVEYQASKQLLNQ